MNNARMTFNVHLASIVDGEAMQALAAWPALITPDNDDPTVRPPAVAVAWPGEEFQGRRPEARARLCQLTVAVADQDTWTAEQACKVLLEALKLDKGTKPVFTLPKLDYAEDDEGTPLHSVIEVYKQAGRGWRPLPNPPSHTGRVYVLTLVIDYVPG